MKRLKCALLAAMILAGCSSGTSPAQLTIDQPSDAETTFAELRDLYVIGSYPSGVTKPGNIKMELFRESTTSGAPVRTIQSQVDPETCLTPESSLDLTYANGASHGITMVPDIVKEPGGILDPRKKEFIKCLPP